MVVRYVRRVPILPTAIARLYGWLHGQGCRSKTAVLLQASPFSMGHAPSVLLVFRVPCILQARFQTGLPLMRPL
jgi:hypothetical protein